MWIVNDTGLGEHDSKKSKSAQGFVTGNWMAVIILQSLLDEPNPNSPANSLAAQLYQENKREYEKKVIAIVEQSWLNNWRPRYSEESWKEHFWFLQVFFSFPLQWFISLSCAWQQGWSVQNSFWKGATVILLIELLCGKISQRCY